MPIMFRFGNESLPQILIRLHDFLVRDTLRYFEKGRAIRRKAREASKAIKKALRIAKKKKRNPGVMIGTALRTIRGLNDEVEYTRKVLKATFDSMEETLDQIQIEKIEEPIALIENAQVLFERKNFKKAMELLQEARDKSEKKVLVKTRTAIFGGISGEVKDLKRELSGPRKANIKGTVKQVAAGLCHPKARAPKRVDTDEKDMSIFGADTVITGIATIETES